MSEWRFIVTQLNGDGTENIQDFDLPGTDPEFTEVLNGGTEASIALKPQFAHLLDKDGNLLLRRWKSACYFEEDGEIRAGGIYVDGHLDADTAAITLELSGFANYPAGMPYTDSWYAVDIDPTDVFRHIWDHLQSQPGGNLGVQVDPLTTPIRIGKNVAQGEFDTENGPLSFEYEPVQLTWYDTHDLGESISTLSEGAPFDFIEEHRWNADRTAIEHFIRLGYPRLGRVRDDVRMVVDENIVMPKLVAPEEEYASEVLALGAGEGAAMLRATAHRSGEDRIRRVAVFEEKQASSPQAINAAGQAEIARRTGGDRITAIDALPTATELHSVEPGDLVRLLGTLADPQTSIPGTSTPINQVATTALEARFASFNVGGQTTHAFAPRVSGIVDTILAAEADVIGFQELGEDENQDDLVMAELAARGHNEYILIHGRLRYQFLINTNVFTPLAQQTVQHTLPSSKSVSTLPIKHNASGLVLSVWNTHLDASSAAASTRIDQVKAMIPIISALGPSVGGGDLNTNSVTSGLPLDMLDKAGFTEMRKIIGGSVVNGNMDSHDGYHANPNNGAWLDHLFASQGPSFYTGGLIDSGDSSDHNLIYADIIWGQAAAPAVVESVVEHGIDNWVRIVSKTTKPDDGTVSFEVAAPDTI